MQNYIIVTTAKNEENNIEKCILSVIKQTIKPIKWYIVDDNSNDKTADIVTKYADSFNFIKLIRKTESHSTEYGENIVEAFRFGLNNIDIDNYDYICNLDADIEIDSPFYYETLLNLFKNDSKLGILSGITYYYIDETKKIVYHYPWATTGALKMYRRECFEQLGGPLPVLSWDGLDDYRAISRGWTTKTNYDLFVHHLGQYRSINRENTKDFYRSAGRSLYLRGYSLFYSFFKTLQYSIDPGPKYAIIYFNSYLKAFFKREQLLVNPKERRTIRKYEIININHYLLTKLKINNNYK